MNSQRSEFSSAVAPLKVVVAALGGQGGGVVSDWLVEVARLENFLVQTTSVPGVAQRTGATIYYLEFFDRTALPADGSLPIFALMPHAGDVDVVVASELMEAGRALQRGFVTRDRTTLITSSHRVYSISEKAQMADGRADDVTVLRMAERSAKRLVTMDMQAVATAHGSVISAAMLGALAGARVLPFQLESFRKAIVAGGVAVKQSLAAFEAAVALNEVPAAAEAHGPRLEFRSGQLPPVLQCQIDELPPASRLIVAEGARRLIDYQDVDYAQSYLSRLNELMRQVPATSENVQLIVETARYLALWMTFEDTIRVADLKIRASRSRRVLAEVGASEAQIVNITEFMKPRLEEICGTLPAGIGRFVTNSRWLCALLQRFARGRRVNTSHISGFLLLYCLASLRSMRRRTLRFIEEDGRIREWLRFIGEVAQQDSALAIEIAECQSLVKGYGSTHERGLRNFESLIQRARQLIGRRSAASMLKKLRLAALSDEDGAELRRMMEATA